MKTSFTAPSNSSGHKVKKRRSRKTKDSFAKAGGLGSELEGLKYNLVYQDSGKDKEFEAQEEEYDEIQVEDINMNEFAAIQGSFLGS